MLAWITENLGTIVIALVIFLAVALAARSVHRNHKKGGCSCGCGNCPSSSSCHSGSEDAK